MEAFTVEQGLAQLSIEILGQAGVSRAEMLTDYTRSRPQADRAYERAYLADYGVKISARKVKAEMRKLLVAG